MTIGNPRVNPEDLRKMPKAAVSAGKLQTRVAAIFLYSELVGQNNNQFRMLISAV